MLYKRQVFAVFGILMLLLVLFLGCTIKESNQSGEGILETGGEVPPIKEELPDEPDKDISAEVEANEIGQVMILMYHVIGGEEEQEWTQTGENFRRDLQNLYEQGYVLISLKDFVDNNIDIPAGKTPVVLTFDDGTAGHFRYLEGEQGEKTIDPECAVGILLDFAGKHPGFGHTATFYINDRPFGQGKYWGEKLNHLVELGFDIGNHTLTHPRLNRISDLQVEEEIARLAQVVEETVPGYQVVSLALPFGIFPAERELLVKGEFAGYSYENRAALNVGANPAKSPVAVGFDRYRLPRVRGSTSELEKWFKYFEENPKEKYISDGNLETVAIPAEKEELVNKEALNGKKLILWTKQ